VGWSLSLHRLWDYWKKLVRAQEFARGIEILAQGECATSVEFADDRRAADGPDRAQFGKFEVVPIEQVRAVTSHDHLPTLACVA
jgi:hypothetical protein